MKAGKIRPLALCVFHREGKILVQEGYDRVKGQLFYRPLGGKIEFGETAAQTVRRELHEEINVRVTELRYLGTLENIFTYNGLVGHEIIMVFDGALADASLYGKPELKGYEDNQYPIRAMWKLLSEMRDEMDTSAPAKLPPVYPNGLIELLRKNL